ncbi:MAG: HD domain-containing phosphohydrolase [Candidatus Marinimicrobia bacterium]|jgi:HD-GYP domain-containing protein (c-di-GMP phosphodiesterase class II)|nr:phosphohydrolase [Candidatus Neomarinimicrobiota bacterium]MDP5957310.1 HD domain-containing phosphohydrolase [Candidatus Neomarinimicrobiota bacterium]MDP6499399.1 HD domain-containing phosphohydrolase [Candidatus Neomarinimicrobiota bacterium]MDP6612242.1 HD domain-containing phosphohydrolase [Candidatus Neomarinimicrobiota bacterium]MDP6725899.1 HD domain-containing phosphohydrolase [Candidatus Neomarinimicrobiota bacterium]|tara:strand:- start:45177 stop:46880 length:1704 start_codon:yes stop_codon:yes gene_type:complete
MSSKNGKPNGQSFDLSQTELKKLLKKVPSDIQFYINHLEKQVKNLAEIGLSLSKEKDMNVLLENILLEAKRITNADGGTLYMKTDDNRLRFEIMMTDSLKFHMGGTSGQDIPFYPVKLYEDDGKPNKHMISAYVGLTGETVNIPDAYKAKGFDFSGTKAFDEKTGYRSKSFLTVPLKNHEDEIIGVVQLLNAKDKKTDESIPFSTEVQDIVEALSSQAAVAITNKNLIRDLEILFESFIKLIASAIDAKSPYTGGHCSRVPEITMMLAEAVNESKNEHFKDIHFTDKQMYELKIAAWLHDCGKVATPEYVVDKATKLETIYDRVHTVSTRFEVLKRDQEIKFLKRQLKVEKDSSLSELETKNALKDIRKKYREKITQMDDDLDFVKTTNVGGEFMSGDKKDRVKKIAKYRWKDNGESKNFLSDDEVKNLCIAKGTLTAEERKIINDHIVHTIDMLQQLPYPNHLKNVPEFAGGHHEKLDGTGYPMGLTKDEMSIQAKAMAIADVFEALTARDRPYKEGKALSMAMRIMGFMKNDAHVDPFLFELFVKEKIYLKYAEKYLTKEQLDMD